MAQIVADRIRDTTTTTGTGAVTVSGTAPATYQTFSVRCTTNDTFPYFIAHQSADEWECGIATYSAANTVTRTTVLSSSNSDAVVSFSAGTKDVVLTQVADRGYQKNGFTVPNPTITTSIQALDLAQTWNAGGVAFTAAKVNVTNTASDAASRLIDLQVGTNSIFHVTKTATRLVGNGAGNIPMLQGYFEPALSTEQFRFDSFGHLFTTNDIFVGTGIGTGLLSIMSTGGIYTTGYLGISTGVTLDTSWFREAAGIFGQKSQSNLAAPNTYRVYNTADSGSSPPTNYERAVIDWTTTSNILRIGTEKGGTGSIRNIQFVVGNAVTDNLGNTPATKTTAYSVTDTDKYLVFNGSGSITLTLQSAASYPGRELVVKTIAAQTVISASSNVCPATTATAGTAILAATAGKFATLVSDGTNWVIMESN